MIEVQTGSLLIAEPFLKDPNFRRMVVLICRHEEENGSFGFVISRGNEYVLEDFFPELGGIVMPVYEGGPVQKETLHFIHQYPGLIPDATHIGDGIYWGGNFEAVKSLLLNNEIDPDKIRFFLGYSGWDKSQLENEMKEGSWIVLPASRKLVFDTPDDEIWKQSLLQLGGDYKQMVNFPIDPQLN